MLQTCKKLFDQWNGDSISYIHWKSNEHLKEGLDGDTDLDVLLSPNDKMRGRTILTNSGFIKFQSQFGSNYPNVDDWIGYDSETGRLIHLHLHYALMTGHKGLKEYELPWCEEALKTRIQHVETGVYIMNPNLELVTLYTRLILKSRGSKVRSARKGRYKMSDHFSKEISFIKERIVWEEVETYVAKYYGKHSAEFMSVIRADKLDSEQFILLYSIVTKAMKKNSRYHGLSLFIHKVFFEKIIPLRQRLDNKIGGTLITRKVANIHGGISVAFIGQDGSGKSTVTEDIKKWLTWKIEANRFYLGSGDHYNGFLKRLISKGVQVKHQNDSKTINEKVSEIKRKKNIKTFFTSALVSWNMLMIARRAYRVMHKAEKYRRKGGIPLLDRFPQMQFEGISDGPRIANSYRRTGLDFGVNKLMAKREYQYFRNIQKMQPSLVFKLILPPEESIRRKPFENYENVKQKHQITKELVFDNSHVIEIDATQDYQKELLLIKNYIWKEIMYYQG